jgi:MFS family permease
VAAEAPAGRFAALSNRNFRRYFVGQIISMSGTWMHLIAFGWLVLELTGSGTNLGVVTALQSFPVLFFASWGGVLADRFPKRIVLAVAETELTLVALTLGTLVATHHIELWMVYVLAALTGLGNAIDMPTRQVFVAEIVGPANLPNAVTLNSIVINLARIVGPAIAGLVISTLGIAPCFLFNAASFTALLIALALMDGRQLSPAPPSPRAPRQLREGLAYVRHTPELFVPLLMMAVIGCLAFEMPVILPLVARFSLGGDAGTYSLMINAMGLGAVVTGTYVAARGKRSPAALANAALAYGLAICVAAMAPTTWSILLALFVVGGASIVLLSLGNATLQLAADPAMRGRVMSLWTVAFVGSTPIGGPLVGWVGEHVGPRWGLALGGVGTTLAALLAGPTLRSIERATAAQAAPDDAALADPIVEGFAEGR